MRRMGFGLEIDVVGLPPLLGVTRGPTQNLALSVQLFRRFGQNRQTMRQAKMIYEGLVPDVLILLVKMKRKLN